MKLKAGAPAEEVAVAAAAAAKEHGGSHAAVTAVCEGVYGGGQWIANTLFVRTF